jgi:hypothetical protein
MRNYGVIFERVPLMCDNTSAISLAKNPVFHERLRHLDNTDNIQAHPTNGLDFMEFCTLTTLPKSVWDRIAAELKPNSED